MKLIEVNFNGGLGNQLFQYATARGIMKNTDFLFLNVNSYYDDYLERKFKLFKYNIKGSLNKNKLIEKSFIPFTKINIILCKLNLYSLIKENSFFIQYDIKKKTKFFTSILGFWQSEIYFKNIRNELLFELTPKVIPDLPEIIKFRNTVGVHIRRTDYLNDLRYGFIGEVYYWNAISLIKKKVINPCFVIFSDDLQWCKNFFNEESIFFCDEFDWQEDYHQLYLMSKCKHQIIANSSFSWWGAWLNTNPEKIIIRPKTPFRDPTLLYENYYPTNWIAM